MPTIFQSLTKPKKPVPGVSANHHAEHIHKTEEHRRVMGPLTAFAEDPAQVRFETQQADETVELFLRQHIVVNVPWVLLSIILLIAPSFLFPFFFRFVDLPFSIPAGYFIVGTVFWYVVTFGYILVRFLGWFFNIYIVTNQRVVDIDFKHLLYKEFSEARLDKVKDLSYHTGGIVATFFNYGNVLIQTAGEMPNFEFASVPHPERVVTIVGELAEQANSGGP